MSSSKVIRIGIITGAVLVAMLLMFYVLLAFFPPVVN